MAEQHVKMSPGQTYFDVEGDMLASRSEESDHIPLTWRGDPDETYSDFTIVVVSNELETASYHVHKCVMCFGSRQSQYFAKIILDNNSHQKTKKNRHRKKDNSADRTKTPSTKVELDQRDAVNFPIFLDFIYAPSTRSMLKTSSTLTTAATSSSTLSSPSLTLTTEDDNCSLLCGDQITTDNALSLRYLARVFENDSLMRAVNKFIQKDLNFKTGPIYLNKAWEYQDERLMESAQRLCAENIEQIDTSALVRLPLNVFRVVIKSLESFQEENKQLSHCLSEIVCRYLEKHRKARSAKLLLELTDEILMPYIAPEAAIGYTAIIKDLDPDDAASHWNGLARLSQRCAKSVVKEYGWSDFSVNAAVDEYLGVYCSNEQIMTPVDSLLFATSFAAALEQAQDDYEQITAEQEHLQDMVNSLHESVTLLEFVNQRKDQYIAMQQSAVEDAKQQIIALKNQIGEIKRQHVKQQQQQRQPPPRQYSPTPIERQRQLEAEQPDLLEMNSPPTKDLISPAQVATNVHENKNKVRLELKTKSEMRSRSLLV